VEPVTELPDRLRLALSSLHSRVDVHPDLRGAVLVGSMVTGKTDALSDIDCIVITANGAFDDVWADRCTLHEPDVTACWDGSELGPANAGAHKWLDSNLAFVECLITAPNSGVRLAPPHPCPSATGHYSTPRLQSTQSACGLIQPPGYANSLGCCGPAGASRWYPSPAVPVPPRPLRRRQPTSWHASLSKLGSSTSEPKCLTSTRRRRASSGTWHLPMTPSSPPVQQRGHDPPGCANRRLAWNRQDLRIKIFRRLMVGVYVGAMRSAERALMPR
jgi:hypothetical protein